MTALRLSDSGIRDVSPGDLYAYLRDQGWRRLERFGDSGDIFSAPGGDAEVLVPSQVLADYERRVREILEVLSAVQARDPRQVLQDISLTMYDLVRVRLSDRVAGGSMPIDYGVERFRKARDLVTAAACAALRPQKAFRAAGRMKGIPEYMNRVRLGPTEHGSFVINLLCPVPPSLDAAPDDPLLGAVFTEPFERRVTHKLVSGLQGAREGISDALRGDGFSAFAGRVDAGVSANLCQAIAGLVGSASADAVGISVSWAAARREPGEFSESRFTGADVDVLEQASRVLRQQQEYFDERIEGYVKSMSRDRSVLDGQVVIKGWIDDGFNSVRVILGPDDYTRIAYAHARRLVVSLEGDLRREGRGWTMSNPRDLAVIEDDDEEGVQGVLMDDW